MASSIENKLHRFLSAQYKIDQPVLLAFSGGPDSLALLHLLLDYQKKHPLRFALAHVDHGWREESKEEARLIAKMADELGLALHLKTLDPRALSGNLEAACREERLLFFAFLCDVYRYQAVLLAHHADDLAETVLKRALEGASLAYLSGLRPQTEVYGIKLWRPLLEISKKEIGAWLYSRGLKGFEDRTNNDPRFLRGKFRTRIIPQLSQEFGKEAANGLCRIGVESTELRAYLDERIAPYLSKIIHGKLGDFLDLSEDFPKAPFELKYLIRRYCESRELQLSRDALNLAATLFEEGTANKAIIIGNKKLYIDRRRLFLFNASWNSLPHQRKILKIDEVASFGHWRIKMTARSHSLYSFSDWKDLWRKGILEAILPDGVYEIALPESSAPYPRSLPLSKWWTDHKIPAFLRNLVPILYENGSVRHEFLTGKLALLPKNESSFFTISLWIE